MSATAAILERWRRVTADVDPETAAAGPWKDEPVAHFLHAFRPDGARLPELFVGMPEMGPVLERLRVIFERAGRETGHLYFMVSRPRPMDAGAVQDTVQVWLNTVGRIANRLGLTVDDDVARFLAQRWIPIEWSEQRPERDPGNAHPVEHTIYEAVTELGRSMTRENSAAQLLIDPLYMLACSYELAYWVLSPIGPEAEDDPFAPAVALWEAGIALDFAGEGSAIRALVYRSANNQKL